MIGNGGGLCSGGKRPHYGFEEHRFHGSHVAPRPYLHMFAHSNELEEKGVINLNAVNVESNPDMEMLLGVSRWCRTACPPWDSDPDAEKIHPYAFHGVQLLCPCRL